MDDGDGEIPDDPRVIDYEELIAAAPAVDFEVRDEKQVASMCYTSGTTEIPKVWCIAIGRRICTPLRR